MNCSVSKQAHSHRAGPTQQLGVRITEPDPPRSNPAWVSSLKVASSSSVRVPSRMMSPVDPWRLVRPEPCRSQRSQWKEAPVFSTLETDSSGTEELVTSDKKDDLGYLGRAETFFDISEASNLAIGTSFATSVNNSDGNLWTRLWGAELTFRWNNPRRAVYHSLTWRNEVLYNDRERSEERRVGK